ncbi:hypothetical protein J5N97_016481 [Dioscorea zingiberensis]|uniref:DNA polymerase delta small subunit n=1 Tax=Dioscorea zingiberensis TaxID=325984 RepID=A0A9D5CJN0_9LILI|nr:hypothetical protein J5N97_016481 [Dioscorea zingiberensis]
MRSVKPSRRLLASLFRIRRRQLRSTSFRPSSARPLNRRLASAGGSWAFAQLLLAAAADTIPCARCTASSFSGSPPVSSTSLTASEAQASPPVADQLSRRLSLSSRPPDMKPKHPRLTLTLIDLASKPPVQTVLGLEEGKECIVVGTIYKHMKLKPSILDEYSKERSTVPLVKPHNFMHPDDHLILEDESGRVKLTGNFLAPSTCVTGIVLAVHGKETSDGDLMVQSVLEAGLPPQKEILPGLREDKYVVLISGLSVGSRLFNPLQFQLFVDHTTGHLGDENEQNIASQTVHLVIAGNSVEISQGLLGGQTLVSKDQLQLSEPIKELDILLTQKGLSKSSPFHHFTMFAFGLSLLLMQLAAAMLLDIMPGPKDPANFSLPQQPLNRCLFPGASVYNTFMSCTNPHHFELDGIQFIGTSGQNIDDLDKYSEARDKVEFMERTLRWRHLAPTAPNTLGND